MLDLQKVALLRHATTKVLATVKLKMRMGLGDMRKLQA
eukprot:COSAG05_NODE_1479_length_4770_cov_4.525583_9_plen_38_part_00